MSGSGQSLEERQALLNRLLDAVKQCQIRFGGRTELATDTDSRVACLCSQFETVLQHGIRRNNKGLAAIRHVTEMVTGLNLKNTESESVFWHVVREHLTKHEYERYILLKNIVSDTGRGRAWLRSALNEHSLERYMHMILGDTNLLSQYYEDWAFLLDQERSSMLPMMAAGLGSILFAINIDNPDLNAVTDLTSSCPISVVCIAANVSPPPVIAVSPNNIKKEKKRKKKVPAQIVSFDEEDLNEDRNSQSSPSFNSAPPTCLSSPSEYGCIPNELIPVPHSLPDGNIENRTSNNTFSNTLTEEIKDSVTDSNWQLRNTHGLDNSVASNSDMECSGSYDEFQQSESSKGSGPGEGGLTDNADSKATIQASHGIPAINKCAVTIQTCLQVQTDKIQPDKSKECESVNPDEKSNSEIMIQHPAATLTPVNDMSVGELIPVTGCEEIHSEDSVSLPSYSEDTECAAAAIALQKVLQNSSGLHLRLDRSPSSSSIQGTLPQEKQERAESITNGDLKHAIIAMMQKKEEADEQNRSLRNLLDREMEMCAGLRVEIEDIKKKQQEKVEKLQTKIQALTRENELLKHQLKKYVGAVQMLKRDGARSSEAITGLIGDITPAVPEPTPYIDYHLEATEYERKLIQVAEMHGELMEFNERLHRLLSQKEAVVRRLREELVDLRGPLPDDNQTSDDDISITSDYDTSSMTTASRALINIWIPSAFLTGKSSDSHHVYQVYIRIRDDEWNIYRRYTQFYGLHKALKKKNPVVNTFDFPPKKAIGNKDAKFVEERRKRLQHYLRCIVNLLIQNHQDLSNSPDKETLVTLMPFFGEVPNTEDTHGRRHTSRSPFSRLGPNQSAGQSSQHYTGL